MPFTFLPHQAPVLPLKLAAPRWFDGTALVVGSTAPDLVFALHGTRWYVDAHAIWPQVWLCLPLSVALTWLVKRHVAGVLAPHLPDAGEFHLNDYGLLASWPGLRGPRAWLVVSSSALLGSISHLVLDSFTHGFGWVVQHVTWLRIEVLVLQTGLLGEAVYVYDLLQIGASVVGAAIATACLYRIGRQRVLRRWYAPAGMPLPTRRSRRRLWSAALAGLVVGVLAAILMRGAGAAHSMVIRVADITFVGLLIGCVAARPAMADVPETDSPGEPHEPEHAPHQPEGRLERA